MKVKVSKKRKPLKRINKTKYRFWNELRSAQSKQLNVSGLQKKA